MQFVYFMMWLRENFLGIVAVTVSVATFSVAFLQWKLATQKLRLDLYNRRFAIFEALIDFHNALTVWKDTPEQNAATMRYIKAKEEARFLFSDEPQIYDEMQMLWTRSGKVVGLPKLQESGFANYDPKRFMDLNKEVGTILVKEHADHIDKLKTLMGPYLNFQKL